MCGIVGFTHKNWVPDAERIRSATATLVHRGPDQQGVFESNLVSLGATRLKIIDLGSGDQPITAAGTTIVFNGEIYNHLEIRAELEELGHRFHSRCPCRLQFRGGIRDKQEHRSLPLQFHRDFAVAARKLLWTNGGVEMGFEQRREITAGSALEKEFLGEDAP